MEFEISNEQLARRVQAGADTSENMLQLWEQCRGFVAKIARKYQGAAEMDDLMQEGYLALCDAVNGYDQEQGMSFLNYAAFYIKRRMARCCQDSASLHIPLGVRDRLWKYKKLVGEFRQEYGRDATDRELCALMAIDREQLQSIRRMEHAEKIDSLDRQLDAADGLSVGGTVPDAVDVEEEVLKAVQQEELEAVLWPLVDTLDAEQAEVIRAKYQDGMTWAEIAERTGISPSLAAARARKGLWNLRKPRSAKVLLPFLDEYISTRAYSGNGVQAFSRTWTSSTERVAIELAEIGERGRATPGRDEE
ncbi:MAG: sigma-70 family RNA polymerase sigma factor [Lachnospiraceae bacterium]|nr:sigma-70 family RNA polymerase sigma factor [Lachnospiraceae bacterium]